MKRFLAFALTAVCMFSFLTLYACEERRNKCATCTSFSDEIVYKEENKVLSVGNACLTCGTVRADETISVDYVANTANDVTAYQQSATGDVTILLKAGDHLIVYALARTNGKTRIIAEDGARIQTVSLGVDTKDVIIENFDFQKFADVTTGSNIGIHLATGGAKFYTNICVKNCTFLNGASINGAWSKGVADGWVIENNVFDYTGFESSNLSAIQIEETDGETIIRNNVFKNVPYCAIRLGAVGSIEKGYIKANGDMTIENNVFTDCVERAIRIISYYELNCEINGNVFDTEKTVRITTADTNGILNINVGRNSWRTVPSSIENASYYNPTEQEII